MRGGGLRHGAKLEPGSNLPGRFHVGSGFRDGGYLQRGRRTKYRTVRCLPGGPGQAQFFPIFVQKGDKNILYRTDADFGRRYDRTMTEAEVAVLDAARKWVEAKEATLAVDEARAGNPVKSERALDQAEYELTDAVYRLMGRGPSIPLHH